jgi:hypothetical protein
MMRTAASNVVADAALSGLICNSAATTRGDVVGFAIYIGGKRLRQLLLMTRRRSCLGAPQHLILLEHSRVGAPCSAAIVSMAADTQSGSLMSQ